MSIKIHFQVISVTVAQVILKKHLKQFKIPNIRKHIIWFESPHSSPSSYSYNLSKTLTRLRFSEIRDSLLNILVIWSSHF